MEFFTALNLAIVGGIIIIIETVKYFLTKRFNIPADVWKLVVIGTGAIAALLVTDWSNFVLQTYFQNVVMYAGAATLIYQTGKLAVNKTKDAIDAKKL